MSVIHVVSVSSGKDSDATLLLALHRYGRERVRAVIADTGNEHTLVWEHIAYLEARLGNEPAACASSYGLCE
jgi:tRNA(Ile)-lysidine synthase TilS/MesJ